jgi:hypothetical protein
MRTGLFVAATFLLLAASVILGKLFSGNYPAAALAATIVYVTVWLAIARANMRVGVAKAGYSMAEAAPICRLILVLPAAGATVLKCKLF